MMAHTPFGYRIVAGKIEVHEYEANQLKKLFKEYLLGASMSNAGKKANINRNHSSITKLLTDERYLGDEIFPPLIARDTFEQANQERFKRAKQLGRLNKKKEEVPFKLNCSFSLQEIKEQYDNPIKQAEYVYSLIQSEVT